MSLVSSELLFCSVCKGKEELVCSVPLSKKNKKIISQRELENSDGANKKLTMFFGFPGGGAAVTASR